MERLLEIIGEASAVLSDETTTKFPAIEWTDIRRMRILIAHHYHRIDPDQVWTMATVDISRRIDELGEG